MHPSIFPQCPARPADAVDNATRNDTAVQAVARPDDSPAARAVSTRTEDAAAPPRYPLRRDAAEHSRLQSQAAFWDADAAALFECAGIAPGWRVADLGCGTLHVASRLARCVGPAGHVRAIDNDPALLARLAPQAAATEPCRIQLVSGDAYATGWPAGRLDAAHARFLAAPAGRLPALVGEMSRLVRPGGLLILQEPDAEGWSVLAAGSAWTRMLELIRAGFTARGGHFDAGRALATALAAAGIGGMRMRRVAHSLPASHPYAALPLAFARQLRPAWIDAGLASEPEIDDLCRGVAAALDRGGPVNTFTLVQAWGTRGPGPATVAA